MEIGVFMPVNAQALDIADLARTAEAAGFESMWMPEHPVMPVHTTSRYRGTPDGSIPPYMQDMVDPYMALSRASAVTSTIKLGTSISLIPERNPLMLAKVIATPGPLLQRPLHPGRGRRLAPRRDDHHGRRL